MIRWIEWVEPFGPNFEPVYKRATTETVIAFMKEYHPELTDEEALYEFMVVNWAYEVGITTNELEASVKTLLEWLPVYSPSSAGYQRVEAVKSAIQRK